MTYASDIPLSLAVAAHAGTSFVSDRRGAARVASYGGHLEAVYAKLQAHAVKGGTLDRLDEEFARYRGGYRKRVLRELHSRQGCMSTMITGGSNFPVERQRKRWAIADKRMGEVLAFQEYALQAAIRNLRPDLRPIMAGDADALVRLARKLAEAELHQARMKAVNSAHKHYQKDPDSLAEADLSDADKQRIKDYVPAYSWEPHPFAPYELTNNNANIRRMRERLDQIERAQATPDSQIQGENGVTLDDCPAENRVRLTFTGKPAEAVRTKLKKNGFRWAPSLGVWQAYRNSGSIELAKQMVQEG